MRLEPEEHLDAALGQLSAARLEQADAEDREAIEDLEGFLASTRRMAARAVQGEAGSGARVAERVLLETTRADMTWRGDLRVVGRFLRRRLDQSPPLRAVAALLLLQVLLAPGVLAFLALRPAPVRPEVRLGLELPADEVELREAEQQLAEALPVPLVEDQLPGSRDALRAAEARAVQWLEELDVQGTDPLAQALAWRAQLARPRADVGSRPASELALAAEDDLSIRSILLEAELDRFCRGSLLGDPEAAARALLVGAPEERSAAEADLWRRATGRARSLGLLREETVVPRSGHDSSGEAWLRAFAAVANERGVALPIR